MSRTFTSANRLQLILCGANTSKKRQWTQSGVSGGLQLKLVNTPLTREVDVEVVVSRRHKADSQIPQPMLREVRHCLVLDGIFPKLTLS